MLIFEHIKMGLKKVSVSEKPIIRIQAYSQIELFYYVYSSISPKLATIIQSH